MPRPMTRAAAAAFYARLAEAAPAPKTELDYVDPYTLLVAVTLSAQATDVGVNKATAKLFPVASTPQQMVDLGEERLGGYIKTIGLWRNKAKNVVALSKMLIEEHGGEVPADRDALERLPGVGRKTANVVCNVAFGQPTIAVDTHIFRVSNRTGLAPGKTPLAVEERLEKVTPKEYVQHAHHWLILHGRYVCVARTPKCPECAVKDLCLYKEKTGAAPKAAKKPAKKKAAKKTRKAGKAAPGAEAAFDRLKRFALSYPEAEEAHPWGETAVKVRGKSFCFLAAFAKEGEAVMHRITVKLPVSAEMALTLPFVERTGYGLGRAGWVTANFAPDDAPPVDMLEDWIDQSYRAVAPKTLAAGLAPRTPAA